MTSGRTRRALFALVLILAYAFAAGGMPSLAPSRADASGPAVSGLIAAHRVGGSFRNLDPGYKRASFVERAYSFIVGGTWFRPENRVAPLPEVSPDTRALRDNGHEPTVTWIGHSTLLVQLDGVNFLTDPTWRGAVGPSEG